MSIDGNKGNLEPDLGFNLAFLKCRYSNHIVFSILFVAVLLWFLSFYGNGTFIHESPYQFVAGDMFYATSIAEGVKYTNYLFEMPPFLMKGDKGTTTDFALGFPIVASELSFFTGAETFDTLFHMNLFFILSSIFFIYLLLKKVNIYVAIFSLPLTLFIFRWPFSYLLTWGGQMAVMNMFVILCSALAFIYLKERWMFVVFGLFNALGVYAYGRLTIILNICLSFFFLFLFLAKKFDLILFKQYLKSLIVSFLLVIPVIPFYIKFAPAHGVGLKLFQYSTGSTNPVLLSDFGVFKWLIIFGVLLAAFIVFTRKLELNHKFVLFLTLGFIFNSYFSFFGNETSQMRRFFPITLAIFMGFLIYNLYSAVHISLNSKKFVVILIVLALLLITAIQYPPTKPSEYSISNPYTWSAFKWVRDNIGSDENLLFLYGDNHYQSTLFYLTRKVHASVEQKDYLSYLNNGVVPSTMRVLEGSLGNNYVRHGFFDIEHTGNTFYSNESLCDFDYVYYNKFSQTPIVQQYTNLIGKILIKESGFSLVYENELVVILKNPKKGGVCFVERKIN